MLNLIVKNQSLRSHEFIQYKKNEQRLSVLLILVLKLAPLPSCQCLANLLFDPINGKPPKES